MFVILCYNQYKKTILWKGETMPELPEVENVCRTLRGLVVGKKIKDVHVFYPKIITGEGDEFIHGVKGQKIVEMRRVGKYLVFILENTAFISHLRMEGKYRYLPGNAGEEVEKKDISRNKHDHLEFVFTDGSRMYYNDLRKFGRLQQVDQKEYQNLPPLNQLGPEPWEANASELYHKIHKSNLPIKSILLDQRVIAGIGNIYANEICFEMRLNPHTPGSKLSKRRVVELIEVSKEILERSIQAGGTTIHSFSNVGISGDYQQELKVHGKKSCPVCGGEIHKEKVKGRGTYYCKQCQRKK